MRTIIIALEEADRTVAERIAALTDPAFHAVQFVERPRFPTGDAMLFFLSLLGQGSDAVLILIGEGVNARSWILPELAYQIGRRQLRNIAPVLLGDAALPKNWDERAMYFRAEGLTAETLAAFLPM